MPREIGIFETGGIYDEDFFVPGVNDDVPSGVSTGTCIEDGLYEIPDECITLRSDYRAYSCSVEACVRPNDETNAGRNVRLIDKLRTARLKINNHNPTNHVRRWIIRTGRGRRLRRLYPVRPHGRLEQRLGGDEGQRNVPALTGSRELHRQDSKPTGRVENGTYALYDTRKTVRIKCCDHYQDVEQSWRK